MDRRRLAALIPFWDRAGFRTTFNPLQSLDVDLVYFVNAASALNEIESTLKGARRPAIVIGITEDVLTSQWAGASDTQFRIEDIARQHFHTSPSLRGAVKAIAETSGLRRSPQSRLLKAIARADLVICASEAQASSLRHVNPFTFAVAEAIPESDFVAMPNAALDELQALKTSERSTFILWEGTAWGLAVLEPIRPALEALSAEKSGHVRLIVAMPRSRPDPLNGMSDNAQILATRFKLPASFVPWSRETIGGLIRLCDIGIAPMPTLNPFYAAKAHNKPAVYMANGLPVVASDILAYRHLITDGYDGFIAAEASDWISRLGQLVEDPVLRRAMGDAARNTFNRRCQTSTVAAAFQKAFGQAITIAEVRKAGR